MSSGNPNRPDGRDGPEDGRPPDDVVRRGPAPTDGAVNRPPGDAPHDDVPFGRDTWDDDEDGDRPEAWDGHDARRQRDQMAPPEQPCECYCLHCHRTFSSSGIWFQRVVGDPQGFDGFWMCPTPNCGGAGFTFDIFPTDPAHPANAGWHSCGDDDEDEYDEDNPFEGCEWTPGDGEDDAPTAEYDPDEPAYKAMDELADLTGGAHDDDDLEGEEWKYGLQPGQRPGGAEWTADGDGDGDGDGDEEAHDDEHEEDERRYNEPDQRPRELDWTHRDDRQNGGGGVIGEDDIPF